MKIPNSDGIFLNTLMDQHLSGIYRWISPPELIVDGIKTKSELSPVSSNIVWNYFPKSSTYSFPSTFCRVLKGCTIWKSTPEVWDHSEFQNPRGCLIHCSLLEIWLILKLCLWYMKCSFYHHSNFLNKKTSYIGCFKTTFHYISLPREES